MTAEGMKLAAQAAMTPSRAKSAKEGEPSTPRNNIMADFHPSPHRRDGHRHFDGDRGSFPQPVADFGISAGQPHLIKVTTTYRAAAEAVMESVATPIESKVNGGTSCSYMQSFNANDG